MKKRNKLIAFFGAAALTFGILYGTVGEQRFNHCHKHWEKHHCGSAEMNQHQPTINE